MGIAGVPFHRLIDVDEAGCFLSESVRGRGWSLVGKKATLVARWARGLKLNLLLGVSNSGPVAHWVYSASTKADVRLPAASSKTVG